MQFLGKHDEGPDAVDPQLVERLPYLYCHLLLAGHRRGVLLVAHCSEILERCGRLLHVGVMIPLNRRQSL